MSGLRNVWKRCFTQILNKGRVLEQWGQKAFWVVQEPAYRHLLTSYGLTYAVNPGHAGTTVFMVYDLRLAEGVPTLALSRIESATVADLLLAFSVNAAVPSRQRFVDRLTERTRRNLTLRVDWQ